MKLLIAMALIAPLLLHNANAEDLYKVGDTGPTGGLVIYSPKEGSAVEAAEYDVASEDSYADKWRSAIKLSWYDAMGRSWALSNKHNWRLPTVKELKALKALEDQGLVTNMKTTWYWTADNAPTTKGSWYSKAFAFLSEEELDGRSNVQSFPAIGGLEMRIRLVRNILYHR
ncbi:hypothetical protein bplSymb_SCF02601P015 [Bathymodiolus platifrons methanotrophic gill symbiont]|uniref:DUF1566 domain-containing protein n=1 Tax=Bathymodiolus platifrons methanotrophic gill symbiont TaxID=113268 RepID=UPI000B41DAB0|nr:DUF1566 domain-containing protein [Bathymodiolus platifrons methanotrophic gill symbiont]GAW86380.1 hypothetical protein bplSymb_SCF02601P015 [Bathymodiolus platifrons methanotrophic gill symbiont]GFO74583.1 hypothetical protein BPLS_P1369 [Bathymodiolus platifrons methanotrophic gill symbiont]GFO77187.1 hypothetical protein BPLS_P5473 [Bathymodiolus platifrons methanotrophic gill symbiont]